MEKYLKMYGASGIFESDVIVQVEVKNTLFSHLAAQRRTVKQHIQKTFPESLITEAEALLIGDRSGMSVEEGTILRRLGITHLFAISGLHVGLLTFMLREFLLRLKVRRESVEFVTYFHAPNLCNPCRRCPFSMACGFCDSIRLVTTTFGRIKSWIG